MLGDVSTVFFDSKLFLTPRGILKLVILFRENVRKDLFILSTPLLIYNGQLTRQLCWLLMASGMWIASLNYFQMGATFSWCTFEYVGQYC